MPHTPRKRPSRLGWKRRKRRSSPLEFLRDLSRSDRCADLREQPIRFAKLALAGSFVSGQSRELGALDVEEGLL
jgi:hypothetical protein